MTWRHLIVEQQITLTLFQYHLVYNAISFTIAAMGAATAFFWLGRAQMAAPYKMAVTITGVVTLIALYHYFRIFESWTAAYQIDGSTAAPTDNVFNDAYRYMDWLLTVPLLLIELVMVMRLSHRETVTRGTRLAILAALMIILGYPGEISSSDGTRWFWWVAAMIPFAWIVIELFVGLGKSIKRQPDNVRGLVNGARWLTVVMWCVYPIVFLLPMLGFQGGTWLVTEQLAYSIADITAKAVFGVLIYMIAFRKSQVEREQPAPGEPVVAGDD